MSKRKINEGLCISILVENVLNLYGLVVLIVISIFCCYLVLYHLEDIKHGADNQDESPFPVEFLVFYLLMTISTILPYGRSPALRSAPFQFLLYAYVCYALLLYVLCS